MPKYSAAFSDVRRRFRVDSRYWRRSINASAMVSSSMSMRSCDPADRDGSTQDFIPAASVFGLLSMQNLLPSTIDNFLISRYEINEIYEKSLSRRAYFVFFVIS